MALFMNTADEPQRRLRYPELEALLALRGMSLEPMYTYADVGKLFDRSVRSIQEWVRTKKLRVRHFGRPRFVPEDLERFLVEAKQMPGDKD